MIRGGSGVLSLLTPLLTTLKKHCVVVGKLFVT